METLEAVERILEDKSLELHSGNNILVWESAALGVMVRSGGDYPTLHSPFQQPFVGMLWREAVDTQKTVSFTQAVDRLLKDPHLTFRNDAGDTLGWDPKACEIEIHRESWGPETRPLQRQYIEGEWRELPTYCFVEAVRSGKKILWINSPMDIPDELFDFQEPKLFLRLLRYSLSDYEIARAVSKGSFILEDWAV